MQPVCVAVLCLALASHVSAFVAPSRPAQRVAPMQENFFSDLAMDPVKVTDPRLLGEVNLQGFVGSYDPEAFILGGKKYNVLQRIRELKLLSLTSKSGLLSALEEKGLTLGDIERLLPVAEKLGVLSFVGKNKDALLSLAPLAIEPAPILLPLAVSAVKAPSSLYAQLGITLVITEGIVAIVGQNLQLDALLGVPLLGGAFALFTVSNVLSSLESGVRPAVITTSSVTQAPVVTSSVIAMKVVEEPKYVPAPKAPVAKTTPKPRGPLSAPPAAKKTYKFN